MNVLHSTYHITKLLSQKSAKSEATILNGNILNLNVRFTLKFWYM